MTNCHAILCGNVRFFSAPGMCRERVAKQLEYLLILIVIAFSYWVWDDSLKARETAIRRCAKACRQLDMQFLDQTVGIRRLGFGRLESGRVGLKRVFQFEFSSDGTDRRAGWVSMLGQRVQAIYMDLPDGGTYVDGEYSRPLSLH